MSEEPNCEWIWEKIVNCTKRKLGFLLEDQNCGNPARIWNIVTYINLHPNDQAIYYREILYRTEGYWNMS